MQGDRAKNLEGFFVRFAVVGVSLYALAVRRGASENLANVDDFAREATRRRVVAARHIQKFVIDTVFNYLHAGLAAAEATPEEKARRLLQLFEDLFANL